MRRPRTTKKSKAGKPLENSLELRSAEDSTASDPLRRRDPAAAVRAEEPYLHVYGHRVICETDARGYATPDNKSATEIVVDASGGFIPLWAEDTTLRWRFQE